MSIATPAVELDHASFAYRSGQPVLDDVHLDIAHGEFVAIAGPNGGGKTTLLRLLLGLERPQRGRVLVFGEPAHASTQRKRIGYLAQRSKLGADAPVTVREVVSSGRIAVRGPLRPLTAKDREVVDRTIALVGLTDCSRLPLRLLSGGQQQRAFIAKALAAEPSLLVLDEPTTGVDAGSQEALAAFLATLHTDLGTTILYVSHEFGAVERYVERLLLVRGAVVFDGHPSRLPGVWHDPSHTHA